MTALFTLTVALSLVASGAPPACPKGAPSVRDEYRASDAVVIGTVVSAVAEPASKEYLDETTYVVRIYEHIKGKLPAQIRLFSENSSGRRPMRVRTSYLLFVDDHLGRKAIDNCGHSGMLANRRKALAPTDGAHSEVLASGCLTSC